MAIRDDRIVDFFYGRANRPEYAWDPVLPEWLDDALCANVNPDVFFPDKGSAGAEAKRICRVCPVIEKCLEYAVERPGLSGVWGGCTERERTKIRIERMVNG